MTGYRALLLCAAVFCAGFFTDISGVRAEDNAEPQNIGALMQKAISDRNKAQAPGKTAPLDVPSLHPAADAVQEKDTIYLVPGKSKVINLERDGSSVIVVDTRFVNVFLDSPRTAVLVPRVTGATEFSVLDASGNIILNKTVMVSSETDKRYVRIHRICGTAADCRQQTLYYCEDNCVDVTSSASGAN